MLPRDTKKVDELRNNYGFYLNSMISEFERIKDLNDQRHKSWVTTFIKKLIESFTDLQINLNDRCSYYDEIKDEGEKKDEEKEGEENNKEEEKIEEIENKVNNENDNNEEKL